MHVRELTGLFDLGKPILVLLASWMIALQIVPKAYSSDFNEPWRKHKYALVLDAYELNSLNWEKIAQNKRIVGFIGKASDGLSPDYCSDGKSPCGIQWRKYAITRELYHTRRQLAKAHGLKWGAYHLARAGNPRQQAMHFIRFADPQPDEAIVLDLESITDERFMSLEDAEIFAKYLYSKLDRYPLLYANHQTVSHIAKNRKYYPILSRLKLWYARYKSDISGLFPLGNWDHYTLWQFAYGGNCSKKSCPYRVEGTPLDIDVNVSPMSVAEFRKAWPFDGLLEEKPFPVEPTPEAILVSNKVEYPEEEKHFDYTIDPDYKNPRYTEVIEEILPDSSPSPVLENPPLPERSPLVAKSRKNVCDSAVEQMESDDFDKC